MISPAPRMLWTLALLVVPLCAAAGMAPELFWKCLLLVGCVAAAAGADVWRALRRLSILRVENETAELKWFNGRESSATVRLEGMPGQYELALNLPYGVSACSTITVTHHGQPISADFTCMPNRRGRYCVSGCFVRCFSPGKLWQVSGEKELDLHIRVFPDLEKEPGAKLLFHRKQVGLRGQSPVGSGREFERLRDYQPGDSYDGIYWKATARRNRPVVKVFQIEKAQDIYIILDSSRRSVQEERLERLIGPALMLALATESEGDRFGLLVFQDRVTGFVPAGRGTDHFRRCREAIFDVQPSRVSPDLVELFTFLQLHITRRALLLFLTDLDEPILSEVFLQNVPMVARKHVIALLNLQNDAASLFTGLPPRDLSDIYHRLAGHIHWAKQQQFAKNLRRAGVGVYPLSRKSAGLDLVGHYAQIKRRQIL